ncbi:MAG: DUF4352 domain-containing protein [Nitrospinota bacterium]|nr:DUF4352 domain-containing protein [Nitrospinota bacterium]
MRRLSRIATILSAIMLSGCGGSGGSGDSGNFPNVPTVTKGVVGETLENGVWEITVNSANFQDTVIIPKGEVTPSNAGDTFLVINLRIRNLSFTNPPDPNKSSLWAMFWMFDADGNFGQISGTVLDMKDKISFHHPALGSESVGYYAREVPEGSSGWRFMFGDRCSITGCKKGYFEVDLGL